MAKNAAHSQGWRDLALVQGHGRGDWAVGLGTRTLSTFAKQSSERYQSRFACQNPTLTSLLVSISTAGASLSSTSAALQSLMSFALLSFASSIPSPIMHTRLVRPEGFAERGVNGGRWMRDFCRDECPGDNNEMCYFSVLEARAT